MSLSLRALNIVLGVVLCMYSLELVSTQLHAHHRTHVFLLLLTLALVEAVGAAIFLFSIRAGGVTLLIAIAAAAIFHILHGDVNGIGTLAIYATSILAVMNGARARA
jgi:hypothetical protein